MIFFHVINSAVKGACKDFIHSPGHACFSQIINTMLINGTGHCKTSHTIALGQIAQGALKDARIIGLSRLFVCLFKREFFMRGLNGYWLS